MTDLPRKAVRRTARLAALPLGFAGRRAVGVGRRMGGASAERIDERLIEVWPRETKADRARFEKLKEAYVKARYSKHYRITEDELALLGERVEALGQVVETICSERIEALEKTARAA